MSATTTFAAAAKTPYSEAASLEHYNSKMLKELKVLAKLHGISDAGEPRDVVAHLMEKDRENSTWPGMYDEPNKKDGESSGITPAKKVSKKTETPSETKIIVGKKSNNASTATVSNKNTATTSIGSITSTGSNNNTATSMPQLAKEWDELWGPPYALAKPATSDSRSQGTSVTTAESTPTRSKPLVSPITSVSSTSSDSNRYNVLVTDETEVREPEGKEGEEVNEEEIPPMEEVTKKALSVHQKWVDSYTIIEEEKEEERAALANLATNNNVDAGEKTKKNKKRGKEGGKKVNRDKKDAPQSAEIEANTTEALTSGAASTLEQAEGIPLPVSPARPEPTEATTEHAIDVSGPVSIFEENNGAIVEPSPSVAPTEVDEWVNEQIDLHESMPTVTKDMQDSPPSIGIPAPEQPPASPIAITASEPAAKPPKKATAQNFHVAPPLSPPSTQTASAPTPIKTNTQRRNEKRKGNKQVASSNMYNVLIPDELAGDSTPNSSNTKENNNGNSGEGAAPAAKKDKRGAKGGKKAQAQKKNQFVPVVETTASPVVLAAVAAKVELVHVVLVVALAILAGAFGAWVKG
ncbi:uncharacterized protein ALTATR162_LOCUS1068 [Alternaria atra]|uniref:Uncharacterized protein n=1 Tax=Alternaria atra TaxID=119953 RepID=A0A8J2HSL7_9PLEO|nr:uncharacterized protein ALTATR162_LOCUS1068 [Alternaria atra]CAG5142058.1 unnamed protein product [Alternaria atra]